MSAPVRHLKLKRAVRKMLGNDVVDKFKPKPQNECPLPGGRSFDMRNPRHYYFPLDDPKWVPAADAEYVVDDDAVLAFEVNGKAYAIPWDVLACHHVVNLVLDDHPYLVTLCDACVGGGLFDASIDGERWKFRMQGMYNATPYVVDDHTGSLWTMVQMRPLHGPAMEIGPLHRLPLVHVTWLEWKRLRPDTVVANHPGEPEDGHGWDHRWPGHSVVPRFAKESRTTPIDRRLEPLDLVLGVEVDGEPRAYPLDVLQAHGGVVHDDLGGQPIVLVSMPGSYLAIALGRRLDDQVLDFDCDGGLDAVTAAFDADDDDIPHLVDTATGSRWDLLGACVDGPLAGRTLPNLWSGIQKWFNWSNLNPGGDVWHAEEMSTVRRPREQRHPVDLPGGGAREHGDHAHDVWEH